MLVSSADKDGRTRIVQIITRMNIGGPGLHVIQLCTELPPKRFQSWLLTGVESPGEGSLVEFARSCGVAPVIVGDLVNRFRPGLRDLRAFLAIYRLLRRERPHIVSTHTAKAGLLGRLAARLAGVPAVVHTYHGHVLHGYYPPWMSWLLRQMEKVMARLTTQIIAVSETVKCDLVTYDVAPPERITVIPLGLELERFRQSRQHRGELRRELGLDHACPLVGIVGRIFPVKNHRLFLEAAARIARVEPSARFLVVGDGVLRPDLEDQAKALGLGEQLLFLGWRHDLPRIYADLDVLAVTSLNEGTPMAAIEAMAAGCPVVATRVGGLVDVLTDGETGCLVPPGDPDAFAAAVLRLLGQPETVARITRAASAAVEKRYGVARLRRDMESFYFSLVAGDAPPIRHTAIGHTVVKEPASSVGKALFRDPLG